MYVQYRLMATSWSTNDTDWQEDDKVLCLANNSFYQVREVDNFDRIKWISAFTDVRVIFNTLPTDYPDIKVAISLVRRKWASEHANAIRLKMKGTTGDWVSIFEYQAVLTENEYGVTPFIQTIGNVTLICNVDWSVFPDDFSYWIDGNSLTAEPYFIIRPEFVSIASLDGLRNSIDNLNTVISEIVSEINKN